MKRTAYNGQYKTCMLLFYKEVLLLWLKKGVALQGIHLSLSYR